MSDVPTPGEIVAGKYRIERVLGKGGMGVVVAAHHIDLDEPVAIKFLLQHVSKNQDIVARFLREGRAASKIRGEHVARVRDVGRLESGSPYMVMEYLEGNDLAHELENGPLSVVDAVEYLLQTSEALAEAHRIGIVHRDLKPANLFLSLRPDGSRSVKILDFGISKYRTGKGSGPSAVETRGIIGSPSYMSPEQFASSKDLDARSDIWSLGVILFQMVSGHEPFPQDELPPLIAAICQGHPVRLADVKPGLSPAIQSIVDHCLAKDPGARFQNVAEFAEAIAGLVGLEAATTSRRVRTIFSQRPASPRHVETRVVGSGYSTPPPAGPNAWTPVEAIAAGDAGVSATPLMGSADPQRGHGSAATMTELEGEVARASHDAKPKMGPGAKIGLGFAAMALIGLAVIGVRSTLRPSEKAAATTAPRENSPDDPTPSKPTMASPVASTSNSHVDAAPPAMTTVVDDAPSTTTSAPTVAASTSTPPHPTKPPALPSTNPLTKPATTGTPAAKPSAKPVVHCDPPTYVDAEGIEHFKPECK